MTRIPLRILALLSFAGYVLLAFWFPLLPHYKETPLVDIRKLAPSQLEALGYAVLLIALFAVLGLACRRLQVQEDYSARFRDPRYILLAGALFCLPLLLTFPINATDVYRYYIRGRITSLYQENPLATPPTAFPDDPYVSLAGEWSTESSPYGPLWEVVAAGIAGISGDNLLLGLLLFKALGAGCLLALGYLIWRIEHGLSPGRRIARTLLWSWNPALMLAFVVNAHNDALMLVFLVLGYYLWRRGHPLAGFLVMCMAALIKPIGAMALPIFFLAIWRQLPATRQRVGFLAGAVLGGLLLLMLAFLPFGTPIDLAQRLLREASANGGFSPTTLVILLTRAVGFSVRLSVILNIGTLLFTTIMLWLLWLVWRGRPAVRAVAEAFVAYLATAFTFRIWYSVWPFPWLLTDRDGSVWRLHAGLWFLLCAQLSVLIYGHFRYSVLGGSQLYAHVIGVSFVFLLPLFLGRLSTRYNYFKIT